MENPLLIESPLPLFSKIIPEKHIESALKDVIDHNQKTLTALLMQKEFTWDNLIMPLEEMNDRLAKVWSPVSHLHSVLESEELRAAYNACLPLLTEYHTELMQNKKLYHAIESIANSSEYSTFNPSQKKVIKNELRDFKLAGVNLSEKDKTRFAELQQELSKLSTEFAEHLLDATHAWTLHVTDEQDLKGLSEQDIQLAAETAQDQNKKGWIFTLEYPSYSAVTRFLENRELRRQMYEAYVTRASDQGPQAGKWDNTAIMENILGVRHETAQLLGFSNYAEYSLATKMADTPQRVLNFLTNLVSKAKIAAASEMNELIEFAKEDNITDLQAWDIAYYTEKLRQQKYNVSQEELKPYFPADKALQGLFDVVNKLYGLHVTEQTDIDVWHPQVRYFLIHDSDNNLRGGFYIDLYAREHKRDGAWMDECRSRRKLMDGSLQHPVAYLTCNFTRPTDDHPALLTQHEVETLFHEFGHCLHHILTQIDYSAISGINGVLWDAVEFPSQIMEHWCWEKQGIALISSHYQTGEVLPENLYKKLHAAKTFQSGMQMLRQIEFSLFDFRIHLEYDPAKGGRIQSILDEVRDEVAVIKPPAFNRFQHTFSHIFAGGYAAGYYSYKWAEVLSSDAFSLFEEKGTFNAEIGKSFMKNILEQGGLPNPMDAFIAFRGREPQIDALLRHAGLA
ncbi:MAG: M3 family metallopeptidase [Gammaproteobacteria bacterium]|nr:M3 family metallopeptidase [Gammaproteobacteria bacterium]